MKNRIQGLLVILLGGFLLKMFYGYNQAYQSGEELTIYMPHILLVVIEKLGIEQGLMVLSILPIGLIIYGLRRLIFNTKG